jgi:hypothetical protein
MQVDPVKPTLSAPEAKRLKLKHVELLSYFAVKLNSRRFSMVVTREGVDSSIVEAAAALGLAGGWEAVVQGRCKELLREYSTSLKQDRALLSADGGVTSGNEAMAAGNYTRPHLCST